MKREDLTKKIISLIPSLTLKETIYLQNHQFSELDLVAIIDQLEKILEEKLILLSQVKEVFKDKQAIDWADKIFKNYQNKIAWIEKEDPNYIYSISIKYFKTNTEQPTVFMAKSYDNLIQISELYQTYLLDIIKYNPETTYRIIKQKLYVPTTPIEMEEIMPEGIIELGYKYKLRSLYCVKYYSENPKCRHNCTTCDLLCSNTYKINYPSYINQYDIVFYKREPLEQNIFLNLFEEKETFLYAVVIAIIDDLGNQHHLKVINMNSPEVMAVVAKQQDDKIGNYVELVKYTTVNVIKLSELPKHLITNYHYLVNWIKEFI